MGKRATERCTRAGLKLHGRVLRVSQLGVGRRGYLGRLREGEHGKGTAGLFFLLRIFQTALALISQLALRYYATEAFHCRSARMCDCNRRCARPYTEDTRFFGWGERDVSSEGTFALYLLLLLLLPLPPSSQIKPLTFNVNTEPPTDYNRGRRV